MAGSDNGGTRESPTADVVRGNLVQVMWRSRWIALAVLIASVSAGFVYVSRIVPVYTSTSRIYVEPSGPRILTEAEGVMTQSKNYLYTQAELLKSTPILLAALEQTDRKKLKVFEDVANPVAYLKEKGLGVSVGKKDDIISISFDSPDPCEAADFVNAVVDSYITYHATRKRSTTGEILRVLQQEKRERDQELSQKLKAMMEFKSDNSALAFERQDSNIILDALDQLSAELRQAQLETIEAGSDLETVKSMAADPAGLKQLIEAERAKGANILVVDERTRLTTEIGRIEDKLSALDERVTPNHPWLQALRQELERAREKLARLDAQFATTQLAVAQRRHEAALEKESRIASYFEEQSRLAIELNKKLAEYRILQSDWEQTKKLCDIIDDRIKEVNVTEDVGCLYISILERAHPADAPSGPPKTRYVAFSLLMGVMLAVGLTLGRDYADQRFRSEKEVSAVLGMPILGTVSSMPRKLSVSVRGRKAYLEPKSSWAQAYRRICAAVLFDAPKVEVKTILVASPTAADGGSVLASNLAIAMAQAGQRTLLLDADFRAPRQHRIFRVKRLDVGLTTTLAGITMSAEAIQATEVEGVELMAYGPNLLDPSQMLNGDGIAQLLDILADRYDRIVVDSPAMARDADARTLAAACNATVIVVAVNKSARKTALQVRDGLLSAGARILGVVVNDVSIRGHYDHYSTFGQYRDSRDSVRPENADVGERKPAAVAAVGGPGHYAFVSDCRQLPLTDKS